MADKIDIREFFRSPDTVAVLVAASEIFGLLSRSVDLPQQWAALVTRESGDHVLVKSGERVEGEHADEVLFVRTAPLDLEFTDEGLTSGDGYQCKAGVLLRLSIMADSGELLTFSKTMLGSRRQVTINDITGRLQPTVRAALVKAITGHSAEALVDGESAGAVSAVLASALEATCFSSGIVLGGAPNVQFASPALRKVRDARESAVLSREEHEASRELQEALRASQEEHLDHLSGMLAKLKGLATSSPDVELPELLRTFSEQQRGQLYEALFASPPTSLKTRWIAVAAGDELLFFDPNKLDRPTRRLTISGPAGAVRSVHTADADGAPCLLLGASTGVYRLPIDRAEPDLTLLVEDAPAVRGGFNSATLVDELVFASHSELGICRWSVADPDQPVRLFESMTREARTVRGIAHFDGSIYCAIGDRIIRFRADGVADRPEDMYTGSRGTITAVCPTRRGLFAGNSRGEVLWWQGSETARPELLHAGKERAVESIRLLSSCGIDRLVFCNTSVSVYARVLGDNFTGRYEAGGQTLMQVEVADDLLVATSEVRDRLICWSPDKPQRPLATILVAQIAGHIRDVCLVSG